MNIKILGTGCKKCTTLEEKVKEVIKENNINAEVEKVTEIQDIMKYNVMMTPGLVINEKVKSYGIIPKEADIIKYIEEEK